MTGYRHRRLPLLPLVLGTTDGLLNALTLASAAILGRGGGISLDLSFRVATAALVTAAFTIFVADYAERRASLVRASRELHLTSGGQLAATRLGRAVTRESLEAMAIAAASSFVGAALPLLAGALLPVPPWMVLALTVLALAMLGWQLGQNLKGNPLRWALMMGLGGIVVTAIGLQLHIT